MCWFPLHKMAATVALEDLDCLLVSREANNKNTGLTAPPIMNSRSSSCCTHWAILVAHCTKAFRFALGSATQ